MRFMLANVSRLPDDCKRTIQRVRRIEPMSDYLRSTQVRIGLALLVFGSGPLIGTMVAAKLGLTADRNPNPVVFGIMAFFTFWPSIALIALGVARVREARREQLLAQTHSGAKAR